MLHWLNFLAFLVITGYAVFLIFQIISARYAYIKRGKEVAWTQKDWKERFRSAFVQVFGQTKLLKDKKSGIMHVVMFYGFIILQFGALDIIWKGLTGHPLPIPGYQIFLLFQEITVFLVLLAVLYSAYRRYGEKAARLKRGWKPSLVIFFIFFLMWSVLMTMSFERVWHGEPYSPLSPITSTFAAGFSWMSAQTSIVSYYVAWWAHLLILLSFAIYVPQSKHFHLITAPLNLFLRKKKPAGKLTPIDFTSEDVESYGTGNIEDFDRKQMLDFYACVECGRCTNVCPASATGKVLSPMHMIVKLRDHLTEKGAIVTSKSAWIPAYLFSQKGAHQVVQDEQSPEAEAYQEIAAAGGEEAVATTDIRPTMAWQQHTWVKTDRPVEEIQLIGNVMTEDEIWSCTTCRNCEDQCPVGNEHVDKIVDMRRHLVLMEGRVPQEGQRAMQNIERQGNPWGISRKERTKWIEEWRSSLDIKPDETPAKERDMHLYKVPTVKENPDFDYLFFVGSMGSYDKRSNKVTRAFVQLLNLAGVNFAVLGNEERNSGDTPRRMGNEFLFQQLCEENISIFQKYRVEKIVTTCPHTYNTLKNEYPDFGLEAEVMHHTELLDRLIQEGKLVPQKEIKERITYHDSCYLGRYNDVYEAPRHVLQAIPGVDLVEMERNRENGMCCGAGGGRMWMEETGKRVNIARTEQAINVDPSIISSACPYCLTMMSDGVKQKGAEEEIQTKDVAEILLESVRKA